MKRRWQGRRFPGKRGGRRAAPGRRKAPRAVSERPPRMIAQIVVCGALFVALVGLKLMMPGHLSELRGTLGQWLVRDADFVAAFSAVGRAASGEQAWGDSLSEACVAVFGGEGRAQEASGELIGVTVPEQDVSGFVSERALPAQAVGEQRILGFSYVCPLSGTMTSPFGWRADPVSGEERFHYGLDIAGAEGDSVSCFADGSVGTGSGVYIGGIIGLCHRAEIRDVYALGEILGGGYTAALAGYMVGGGIENAYARGKAVGSAENSTMRPCSTIIMH